MPIAVLDQHSCWKTCQISFLEEKESGQDLFTGKWPREGMIVSGKLYQQQVWEHLTSENVGGVLRMWLTPSTVQIEPKGDRREKREAYRKSIGRKDYPGCLAEQVATPKFWPTPRAQDSKHGAATEWELNTDHAGTRDSLRVQVVKQMWPTPQAFDAQR